VKQFIEAIAAFPKKGAMLTECSQNRLIKKIGSKKRDIWNPEEECSNKIQEGRLR
jgi:hypothetical protein